MLGGLSMTEIIIILGLALLLLGPDQLPSLAKSLGKGLREFESEIARIDLDQPSQKSIAPVPSPADEAAKALEPPANPADDPAAARAAARRAAAESQLKLVGPEGSVPRKPEAPPAAAEEPKA